MTELFNQVDNIQRRRNLRSNATKSERLLWSKLRNKQLGVKFKRQYGISKYIVDFYCPTWHLVIEIDGITHDNKIAYDRNRQNYLESLGLYVLRFTDDNVKENLDGVVQDIINFKTSLNPPF